MNHELKKKVHQINKGIYPKGYKISNIGIHPKEWEVKTLSQVGKVSSGSTPLRLRSEYYNGDIPWVKTTDLNNSYIYRTEEKINEIAIKKTSVKWVEENSILVAMYGGFNQIGRTGLLKVRGTTNQAISSLFVDEVNYNSEFILHWLNFKKWFWKRYAGSSRKDPNITKKDIENFPLVKPSYPEQQKVARILSTWDKAIELKEKLIVEKKKQKKGLMQKLLTGEIRLPGFFGGWEEVKLSSISTINKGEQLNKIDMIDDGKYPVINGGISLSGYTNKWNKESNTITISEGGNSCGYVNFIKENFWCGGHCYVICPKASIVDKNYLYQVLKFLEPQIMLLRVGSGLPNIQKKSIDRIIIRIPKLNEQKNISKILNLLDKEIDLLQQELEELKLQKKGLMQLLLTGIVRVNIEQN